MKQDPYFKYLAAIILAGVILALTHPSANAAHQAPASAVTASVPSDGTAKS